MKKFNLLIKSLLALFTFVLLCSCEEKVPYIPVYPMSKVTVLERDSIKTFMSYVNSRVNEYKLFVNDRQVSGATVFYFVNRIHCTINGIRYDIELDNTSGGIRAKQVVASINGTPMYSVYYQSYDKTDGRLTLARVDGVNSESTYVTIKYEGDQISVFHNGIYHYIDLSPTENIGNVCNVLDFAGSSLVSNYLINPDLYFLNIYGAPINKLPAGQEIVLSDDNQRVLKVGKYTYEY